jgi:hypothetical protein
VLARLSGREANLVTWKYSVFASVAHLQINLKNGEVDREIVEGGRRQQFFVTFGES